MDVILRNKTSGSTTFRNKTSGVTVMIGMNIASESTGLDFDAALDFDEALTF